MDEDFGTKQQVPVVVDPLLQLVSMHEAHFQQQQAHFQQLQLQQQSQAQQVTQFQALQQNQNHSLSEMIARLAATFEKEELPSQVSPNINSTLGGNDWLCQAITTLRSGKQIEKPSHVLEEPKN